MRVAAALLLVSGGSLAACQAARAQTPLDQANPQAITRELPNASRPIHAPRPVVDAPIASAIGADAGEASKFVGAIRIEGARETQVSLYSKAIEPFVGQRLSNADLAKLSRAVADVARQQGLVFATAWIPPQALELGILTVRIDEGEVSSVRVVGVHNRQLERILGKMKGHATRGDELERQLLLVSDIPGVVVQRVRFQREDKAGVLLVDAVEDRISSLASVDTLGSQTVGPVRATLSVDMAALLFEGDVLTIQGVATPVQPGELYYGYARYAIPLGARGTVVAVRAGAGFTEPGGILTGSGVKGQSREFGMDISQPMLRSRDANVMLAAGFNLLTVRQTYQGTLFRRDRVASLSATLSADTALFGGRLRESVSLVRGLGGFGTSQAGDFYASRDDADGRFTLMTGFVDWTGPVFRGVSLRLAGGGQIASGPLLAVSEMGLGGSRFGRAYGYSERSGDEGVAGSVELRADLKKVTSWLGWMQPYMFADGGVVRNIRDGFGSGELYSAGGGLRAIMGKVNMGVESAFPLNADRFDSHDRSAKFNVQVSIGF